LPGEIYVRLPIGRVHETFVVDGSDTVGDLKCKIHDRCGIDASGQELVFEGRELENERTLSECGIGKGSTLRMYEVDRSDGYYERYAPRGSARDYYDDVGDHMMSMTSASTMRSLSRRYRGGGD